MLKDIPQTQPNWININQYNMPGTYNVSNINLVVRNILSGNFVIEPGVMQN